MNRYKITNLLTATPYEIRDDDLSRLAAQHYKYGKKATPDSYTLAEWLERKQNAYGHPERRFPANGLGWFIRAAGDDLEMVTEAREGFTYTDPEGVAHEVDPVPETARPLSEVHPEWYAVATPTLDGDDVVVPAEHRVVVEDMSPELQAKRIDALWTKANAFAKSGLDGNDIASLTPGLSLPIPAGHRAQILQWLLWGSQVWQAYYTAKAAIEAGDLDATMAGLPEPIDRRRVIEIQTSIAQTAANELSKAQG